MHTPSVRRHARRSARAVERYRFYPQLNGLFVPQSKHRAVDLLHDGNTAIELAQIDDFKHATLAASRVGQLTHWWRGRLLA